jgi:hypothetical protein
MTIKIRFSHLMETVTCSAPLVCVYSRLSDRKVISIHRLPKQIQSLTFTPACVNKEQRTVRIASVSYDHLLRAIGNKAVIKL